MTLALLAVAAGFGLATYGKTIEHARAEVAIQNLRAIQAGQEFYKSRTGAYGSWASAADMANGNALRITIQDAWYGYTTGDNTATSFTATAAPSSARPFAGTIVLSVTQAPLPAVATWITQWGGTSPFVPLNTE